MLTLYHWEPNANSGKPMLTLAEKGVEYRSHYLDLLKFDQHQPELVALAPAPQVDQRPHPRIADTGQLKGRRLRLRPRNRRRGHTTDRNRCTG